MTKKNGKKWSTVVALEGKFIPGTPSNELGKEDKPDQVFVKVRILEGKDVGVEEETYMRLTEQGLPYAVKQLRALGWTCNDITKLTGLGSIKATMQVKMTPNKVAGGDPYRNVSFFPFREKVELSDEALREFASKYDIAAQAEKPITVTAGIVVDQAAIPPARVEDMNAGSEAEIPF